MSTFASRFFLVVPHQLPKEVPFAPARHRPANRPPPPRIFARGVAVAGNRSRRTGGFSSPLAYAKRAHRARVKEFSARILLLLPACGCRGCCWQCPRPQESPVCRTSWRPVPSTAGRAAGARPTYATSTAERRDSPTCPRIYPTR